MMLRNFLQGSGVIQIPDFQNPILESFLENVPFAALEASLWFSASEAMSLKLHSGVFSDANFAIEF